MGVVTFPMLEPGVDTFPILELGVVGLANPGIFPALRTAVGYGNFFPVLRKGDAGTGSAKES